MLDCLLQHVTACLDQYNKLYVSYIQALRSLQVQVWIVSAPPMVSYYPLMNNVKGAHNLQLAIVQ